MKKYKDANGHDIHVGDTLIAIKDYKQVFAPRFQIGDIFYVTSTFHGIHISKGGRPYAITGRGDKFIKILNKDYVL